MANCEICSCGKPRLKHQIVQFETLDKEIQDLIQHASDVRQRAYCPYSKFKVGAAVLTAEGKVYAGCNVENASFTVGLCAERAACATAIAGDGQRRFRAVAVVARQEERFATPCGACRQFLAEFGPADVYCARPALDEVMVTSTDALLPAAFNSLN